MIANESCQPVIFLAEDSKDDAYFFQRAFRKADVGCSLLHAENGKLAIEMLKNANPAAGSVPILMFLDLKMPVVSGFEVLEWLQASKLNPAPKVIVLSGSSEQDDRVRAFNLGAADYLVKPITAAILRRIILEELNSLQGAKGQTNLEARPSA